MAENYQAELYHYGVPGMKWGVRKSEKTAAKIRKHEYKLAKGSDKNFLYRNTMGDYRRGQIARLKNVQAHRKAKERYSENKTAANKNALRTARTNRVVRNTAGVVMGGRGGRGAYHRYRQAGNDKTTAQLKTVGKVIVTSMAVSAAASAGKAALNSGKIQNAMNIPYGALYID